MFKKLVFFLVLSFSLMGCGGSKGGDGGSTNTEDSVVAKIELKADKTVITTNNVDTVKLLVIVKDKDNNIIDGAKISYYAGNTKLTGNTFKTTTTGTYTISAKSGNIRSNLITITANKKEEISSVISKIEILVNKKSITSDGGDTVTIDGIARDQNNNIIDGANISYYVEDIKLIGNTFSTTIIGTYTISAKSGNIISNLITITAGVAIKTNYYEFILTSKNICEIIDYFGANKEIAIPKEINDNTVTSIRYKAFKSKKLTNVIIPNTINYIGSYAFFSNQLTSIVIPNSINYIGSYAFSSNQLTSVTIGNSVTTIGPAAFSSNQLTSVTIPNSVTTIGFNAFVNNQLTSVTIPNSVTFIGFAAFTNNQLTSVVIPNSVTFIDDCAFANNQLTSVIISNSLTFIESSVFSNNQLTSVVIPDSVTTIGSAAFEDNKLISVTIPNSVTYIGDKAFENNPNLTIHGTAGSAAETYANKYNIPFIAE